MSLTSTFRLFFSGILSVGLFFFGLTTVQAATYTIGATGDYATFQQAIDDLEDDAGNAVENISLPITEAITFNVQSGTYTEQLSLGTISGSSALNRVTFQSATGTNTDVVLQFDATGGGANSVWYFNGTDYVTVQNMTIQVTGVDSNGQVVEIDNDATNMIFDGNIFIGRDSASSGSFTTTSVFISSDNNDGLIIRNNEFDEGIFQLYFKDVTFGDPMTDIEVRDNTFTDAYTIPIYASSAYMESPIFHGNTITTSVDSSNAVALVYMSTNLYGAYQITNNTIIGTNDANGLQVAQPGGESTSDDHGLIANNYIQMDNATGTQAGLYVADVRYTDIYHNAVKSGAYGMWHAGNNTNVVNNIFYGVNGSAIRFGGGFDVSDYNNLYTDNNVYLVDSNAPSLRFTDLASYQAYAFEDWDLNSISTQPTFSGVADMYEPGSFFDTYSGPALTTVQSSATVPVSARVEVVDLDPGTVTLSSAGISDTDVQYDIALAGVSGLDNGSVIRITFPAAFSASFAGLTDADVSVSGTNITSSTETFDTTNNRIESTLTTTGEVTGTVTYTIGDGAGPLNDLDNPSTGGVYGIGFDAFDSAGDLAFQNYAPVEVGNTATVTAIVTEALILTLSGGSISLTVDPAVNDGQDLTESTTMTVSSNSPSGYILKQRLDDGSGQARLVDGNGNFIDSDQASGENYFSYTARNDGTGSATAAEQDFSNTNTNVLDASSDAIGLSATTDNQQHTVNYDLNVNFLTPAGVYTGTIYYTVVASF